MTAVTYSNSSGRKDPPTARRIRATRIGTRVLRSGLRTLVAPIVLIGTIGSGCAGRSATDTTASDTPSAWARPTPPGATSVVVYVTGRTGVDEPMVSAAVPASIAAAVDVGESTSGHRHADGHLGHLDRPPEAPGLAAPAGEPVLLSGLTAPLVEGQHFDLVIGLADGARLDLDVAVTGTPP